MNDHRLNDFKNHPLISLGFPLNALNYIQWLCDSGSMYALDQHVIKDLGLPGIALMENAARSIADLLEKEALQRNPSFKVVICCGKGNNGGDGFALARLLTNRGYNVTVVNAGEAKTSDSIINQKVWEHFGSSVSFPSTDASRIIENAEIIIDAIFGTGLEREISGAYYEWIETINKNKKALKWAIDIPSGVDSDDSKLKGIAVKCSKTISIQFGKIGCFQYPGAAMAGRVQISDISIPMNWTQIKKNEASDNLSTWLTNKDFISTLIPSRPQEAHKGTFGHLLNICGSAGLGGAATLASTSALKNGTGLVTACVPSNLRDRLPGQIPEIMTLSPVNSKDFFQEKHADFVIEESRSRHASVLGCGLGVNSQTAGFAKKICHEIEQPLLIDADGLNNLDEETLTERQGPTIITPHPKELSRLCGLSVGEIQEARIATVRDLSRKWGVVILLKGALSIIGCPEGAVFINPAANPSLATAGSGDILSGIIGGFLAQGLSQLNATLAGTFIHSYAAQCLLKYESSMIVTASDLFQGISFARKALETNKF